MRSLYLILAVGCAINAFAEDLSFDDAVKLALENNHDLKSLRAQSNSLRYKSAQSLAPNTPTLTYQKNDVSGLNPSLTPASESYTLSYTLGFPGKAFTQSSVYRSQAESSREDAFAKEIEIASLLYMNMTSQTSNLELTKVFEEEVKKANDLIRIQEKKYATGQAAQVDILNSRVNLAKIEQDLLNLHNERMLLQSDFLNILGRPEGQEYRAKPLVSSVELSEEVSLNALAEYMRKNKPSLKSAQAQLGSFQSALTNSKLQVFPDFQFSVGVNQFNRDGISPVPGVSRDYNFGITVSVPLFFPLNEMQGMNSARADVEVADNKLRSVQTQATSDLINAYTSFNSLRLEYQKMKSVVLPAARASYQLTLSSYSMGKTDFLRLSDARSTYIQSEKDLIAKKRQIDQTYIQLLQTVGCDFNRKSGPHACE